LITGGGFFGGRFGPSPPFCAIEATDKPATNANMNNIFLTNFISVWFLFAQIPATGKRETSGHLQNKQAQCQRRRSDANVSQMVGKDDITAS
jgi:hypothetical protein